MTLFPPTYLLRIYRGAYSRVSIIYHFLLAPFFRMSRGSEQGNFVCAHLLAYRVMGLAHWDILLDEVLSIFGKRFSGKVDVLIRCGLMDSIQLRDTPIFLQPGVPLGITLIVPYYF